MIRAFNKNDYLFLVKLILTSAALFFVFSKINFHEFTQTYSRLSLTGMIGALIAFNLSKIVSAFRLLQFYRLADVKIHPLTNLRFYYMGMFYNLFLPGSIGGDAYKVYLLKQQQQDLSVKKLISASVLDRISGVSLLFVMAGIFFNLSSFRLNIPHAHVLLWALATLIIPVYYFIVRLFFPAFVSGFLTTGLYSLFVQCGQVICAVCILIALGVNMYYWDYLTLFMVSSVIAVLPFTIGGLGAREAVFMIGSRFLNISETTSVAFTIAFFMITATTSLVGILFINMDKKLTPPEVT